MKVLSICFYSDITRQKPGFRQVILGQTKCFSSLLTELCHSSDFLRVCMTSFFLTWLFLRRLLNSTSIFCNWTRIRYSSSTSFYISDWRAPGMATSLDRWASGNTTLMSIKVSLIISSPLMSYWRVPCCTTFLWASLVCGLWWEISKELSLNVNSWDWSF